MPAASSRKSQIRQRLQAIGLDELRRRLNRAVLWEGLSFSLARWWTEVLGTGRTHCAHLLAGVLQREAHSSLFGVSSQFTNEESELLRLLGKIRQHYDSAFKCNNCSLKTAGSKLLLKYGSSLEKGLSYDGRTWIGPDEIRAHVLHHAQQSEVHNRNLVAWLRKMAPDAEVAEQILKPLSAEDLVGSEELWKRYAQFDRLQGRHLKRALRGCLGPYYDEVNDSGADLSFTKHGPDFAFVLTVDLQSYMAQFCYDYAIIFDDRERVFRSTYEALLGPGGSGWDGIAAADKDLFVGEFVKVDEVMRRVLDF